MLLFPRYEFITTAVTTKTTTTVVNRGKEELHFSMCLFTIPCDIIRVAFGEQCFHSSFDLAM
jgi:hypothetical protein